MKDFVFDLQIFAKINNGESDVLLKGTDEDDYIYNWGTVSNVTITSGKGNDTISLDPDAEKTVITDFDVADILQLEEYGRKPDFAKFANGVLNIDGIKINLPNVTNINNYRDMVVSYDYGDENSNTVWGDVTLGELLDVEAPYWKVSGTTATYYDGNGKLLATLTGLKSGLKAVNGEIEGINVTLWHEIVLSSSVIGGKGGIELTLSNAANNFSLILADDVEKADVLDLGLKKTETTATYQIKGTNTGYYVGANGKKVKYITKDTVSNIATISGLVSDFSFSYDISGDARIYGDGAFDGHLDFGSSTVFGSDNIVVNGEDVQFRFWDVNKRSNYANKTITGGAGSDSIEFKDDSAVITTGKGHDIVHIDGKNNKLFTGDGNDVVRLAGQFDWSEPSDGNVWTVNENNTVYAGNGNDIIYVMEGSGNYIDAGAGNDTIDIPYVRNWDAEKLGNRYYGTADNITIDAGEGDDLITFSEASVTNAVISGGKGNDAIYIGGESNIIKYTSGDGNDTIYGYTSDNTLQIAGSYSTLQKGNDLIVKVGSGSITLKDVASANTVQSIVWTISGTTATGKLNGKTVTMIRGLKKGTKASDLSVNDKIVTISQNALSTTNVSITGGYTLALGGDVPLADVTEAGWFIEGTKATYKTENSTGGYYVAKDAKTITYKKAATSKELTTVEGLSSKVTADDLNLSGKNVTVNANALGKNTVTISGGYTLRLAADVTKSTTTKDGWAMIDDDTAEYTTAHISEGYELASDRTSITYNEDDGGEPIATISGLRKILTRFLSKYLSIGDGVITVAKAALNPNEVITLDTEEDYTLAIGAGAKKSVTTSEGWKISGATATYTTEKTTAGYAVFDDGKSIEYIPDTDGGDILVKLTGLKKGTKTDDLSINKDNKFVKITGDIIGKSGIIVTGNDYEFKLADAGKLTSKSKNTTLTGSSGNDTLIGSRYAGGYFARRCGR